MMGTEFYHDPALWTPPKNCYPTCDDVIRFYLSHVKSCKNAKDVKRNLATFLIDIWESGDGCPKTIKHVINQFEKLYLTYSKYRKEGRGGTSHRKKESNEPPRQPTRKSRRISTTNKGNNDNLNENVDENTPVPLQVEGIPMQSKASVSKQQSKRSAPESLFKEQWMADHGNKLFNILSTERLRKIAAGRNCNDVFDSEYYYDQLDPQKRTRFIEIMKVTKEFYQAQKTKERSLALKAARQLSAYGEVAPTSSLIEDDLTSDSLSSEERTEGEDSPVILKSPISDADISLSVVCRSMLRSHEVKNSISESTQTDLSIPIDDISLFPNVSTRKKGKHKTKLCHPAYLQAGLLMMALCNESPNQAVMNMYIIDTVIYKQVRVLPLRLQKEYQRQLNKMKRYRSRLTQRKDDPVLQQLLPTSSTQEPPEVEEMNEIIVDEDPEWHIVVQETVEENGIQDNLSKAKSFVEDAKVKQNENLDVVLPDPRSVREAHRVASCFLEGEVGKQIVEKGHAYLMPDGTSRAKVGKMGGSLVHLEGKVRALKMQKMGKDTRDNWADTIIFKLKRLAHASSIDMKEIYECIRGIVSDAASVNKGLAAEISSKIGLDWIPGQLYCCIHTVLGFQDGMVSVWLRYQKKIGQEKMYPSITGFELDMEDKCLVKQILECFLRLTADRWQARSWNRYEEFTKFARDNDQLNVGQELHGNRFGELEKCCAIGIYSLELWVNFVNVRSDIRNDLAIFLRDTQHLSDICLHLWLGPALFGIHLTEPYLALLIDKQANHLELLKILPQLYQELSKCEISLAQIKEPAFPSLKDVWTDPLSDIAPYKKEVGMAISSAIEKCNKKVLESSLKEMSAEMAKILKRQRGNAYNFGDDENSPESITSMFTEDELKCAPTHSRDMENLFGVEDSILTRFGPQAFNKSTDDLIIKYSHDLLPSPTVWCTSRARKVAKEMLGMQKEFDEKQAALLEAGVSKSEAAALAKETQIQKFVQQCRLSHNGPLGSPVEVDDLVENLKDDQTQLRTCLIKEIRYRKYSSLSIKFDNPLFQQKNCDVLTLIQNLKLLLMKTNSTLAAKATLYDLEEVIASDLDQPSADADLAIPLEEILPKSSNDTDLGQACIDKDEIENITHSDSFLSVGTHIAANFSDGFYLGEILAVDGDIIKVSYMQPKSVLTASSDEHSRRFWIWPARKDIFDTDVNCVLNLKPCLSLATPPSTKRMCVFACHNAEILEALALSVTEEI